MFKKLLGICLCASLLVLGGCSNKDTSSAIADMPLADIMEKVYDGFKEDELPSLMNQELSKDNILYLLGTEEIEYEEGLASEPMIGSIPHSVVLVKMKDGADVNKAKESIKKSIDPNKWVCVGVDPKNVIVDSKDNVIILIMVDEIAKDLHKNFTNIK